MNATVREEGRMTVELDVVGIGNALVDVLDHKPHEFIGLHDLAKGTMSLIDEERAHQLYGAMAPALEMSGGSAANTMVGIAALGGAAAYIGRVRDDQLGKAFAADLRATGVEFSVPAATDGPATGRCMIVVTPDAQRTMNTYLGASTDLGPGDVDPELIARAKLIYRAVDVLFANEEEIVSLFQLGSFEEAVGQVRGRVSVAALTRGAKGSVVIAGDQEHTIAPFPVAVHDTTGAGDLYAAGFLHGLAQEWSLDRCGRLGSAAAAHIIARTGARPHESLAPLIPHARG